jgi:hypothetical protein
MLNTKNMQLKAGLCFVLLRITMMILKTWKTSLCSCTTKKIMLFCQYESKDNSQVLVAVEKAQNNAAWTCPLIKIINLCCLYQ